VSAALGSVRCGRRLFPEPLHFHRDGSANAVGDTALPEAIEHRPQERRQALQPGRRLANPGGFLSDTTHHPARLALLLEGGVVGGRRCR
jgi:hypothetical protein